MASPASAITRFRRRLSALAFDSFFETSAVLGRLHPNARPERHDVEVLRDIPYLDDGHDAHLLDVYRPIERSGPLPAVLYVHGGGFRILSKDSHWVMGLAFSRVGTVVFNINYRLAPKHPFPAGLQDCAAALEWVAQHAASFGADPDRLVLAGESAGANLVTALTVMCCYPRRERWARRVWDLERVPQVLLPYCGMLQVTDAERFSRDKPRLSAWLTDHLTEVSLGYLGPDPAAHGDALDLADPLMLLERGTPPGRPLPACMAAVGTRDPLLPDTRRLQAALTRLGAHAEARYYPGEIHAFHAFAIRAQARQCWRDTYDFLDRHLTAWVSRRPPLGTRAREG